LELKAVLPANSVALATESQVATTSQAQVQNQLGTLRRGG
jgi:hypothetical protein